MTQHAKTLPLILNDLIEEQATNEPARYRQKLDTLLSRYKQICIRSEETSQYCTINLKSKIFHDNQSQMLTNLSQLANVSNQFRDLNDLKNALKEQILIVDNLQRYSSQVSELINRGNELTRQPMVPKYVQQDVQTLQKVFSEKTQSANDLLSKLKVDFCICHFSIVRKCFYFSVSWKSGNVLIITNNDIINKPKD